MGRNPESWKGKYTKILLYAEKGLPMSEIEKKVGLKRSRIKEIISSDEYQRRKGEFDNKVVEKARQVFEGHAIKAAEKVKWLSRYGKPAQKIQLEASREILHQVGLKPPDVIETIKREYTPDEIHSAHRASLELESIIEKIERTGNPFILPQHAASSDPIPSPCPDSLSDAAETAEQKAEAAPSEEDSADNS